MRAFFRHGEDPRQVVDTLAGFHPLRSELSVSVFGRSFVPSLDAFKMKTVLEFVFFFLSLYMD